MPLFFRTAARTEALLAAFAAEVRDRPLHGPLARESVVVARSTAMRAYVEAGLAHAVGCAASADVQSPRLFVAEMARRFGLVPPAPAGRAYEAAALAWRIAGLLPTLDGAVYGPLHAYLDRQAETERPGGGFALATRLAAAFDDYQVYRPDVLEAWAAGHSAVPQWPHEPWQADLWRRLLAEPVPDGDPDAAPELDRAALVRQLTRLLRGPVSARLALPQRVSVFGTPLLPPSYLGVLAALARHVPVTLYTATPGLDAGAAFGTAPQHPLLKALGRHARDTADLFDEVGIPAPTHLPHRPLETPLAPEASAGPIHSGDAAHFSSSLNVIPANAGTRRSPLDTGFPRSRERRVGEGLRDREQSGPVPPASGGQTGRATPTPRSTPPPARPGGGDALHTLQAALHTDAAPDTATPLDPADRSIRVLDAHSPLREVEALRDELYDAFDTVPGLRPSDVAVLVPDLATYAPLIEAVFGTSPPAVAGRRSSRPALLPVYVADAPRGPERHVLDAFDRLLGLLDGRATASDVLGLLDVPAVRRAAGIEESELSTVHAWVRLVRVHWGRDGAHRARHGEAPGDLPDDGDGDLHTWRFGLDRLLLGVMTGPTDAVVLGRRPVGEGTLGAADLLGRLAEFATALFAALDGLRAPRPLANWADALFLFVDRTLAPATTPEVDAVVALRAAIDRLATLRPTLRSGRAEAAVSLGDVQAYVAHALATLDRDEPYLTGKITVVDPTAARLVPFRVVAFVGLGEAYPRSESRPAFDLLAAHARPGDPDPAGTDRQTFLDAVLSARDRLVLTFTGRSQRDGTERAASSVLDAFLDTCTATFGSDAERLVVRHRLQPFSGAYFDGTLFSYAGQHRRPPARARTGRPFFEAPAPDALAGEREPGAPPVELTLRRLGDVWTHPVRAFCDARGLRPDLAEIDLADDAPTELDALGLYAVKDGLLALLASGVSVEAAYAALRGTGALPPGALGRAWFDRAHSLVADVAARAAAHGVTAPRVVAVEHDAWRVGGTVAATAAGALRVRASSVGARDLVRGWIDHLAISADTSGDGHARWTTVVVGQDKTATFAPLDAADARALLQSLVRGTLAFEAVPVPLFDGASHAYAAEMWKARRPAMLASVAMLLAAEAGGWRPVRVGRALAAAPDLDAYPPAFAAARKAYHGAWGSPRSDATDPHVALCYRHRSPVDDLPDALDRWARLLWAPLLRSLDS